MHNSTTQHSAQTAESVLHVLYPLFVAAAFSVVQLVKIFRPSVKGSEIKTLSAQKSQRIIWCSCAVIACFAIEAGLYIIQENTSPNFRPNGQILLYVLESGLVWICLTILVRESGSPCWTAYIISWVIAAIGDVVVSCLAAASNWPRHDWDYGHLSLRILRVCLVALLIVYGSTTMVSRTGGNDSESEGLLGPSDTLNTDSATTSRMGYGSNDHNSRDEDGEEDYDDSDDEDTKEVQANQKKRLQQQGGWFGYCKSFLIFLPYVLPYRDRFTQAWLVVLVVCAVIDRFLIVLIPLQLGAITDALSKTGTTVIPWQRLLIWGLLKFPVKAVTHLLEEHAKTRISQFAYLQLKSVAFSHVMNLSMDYHTMKTSGKVTKAIEQGTDLRSLIDELFGVGPMFIDLATATIYLAWSLDAYIGLIVLATSIIHIYVSLKGNSVAVTVERISSEKARVENEILTDSLSNWQTMAYFNQNKFEEARMARAVRESVMSQRRYFDWSDFNMAAQDFVMDAGLILAASVTAWKIAADTATVSNFVFLVFYWDSIRTPMDNISWTLHVTASHLINAEWLFQLLQIEPTIKDKPDAQPLHVKGGRVEFKNVSFSYDPQRPILRDLSFSVKPGQSIALVGESGGGKSTLLKLLYRFYDVEGGSIQIDGQDLRDVTLNSLRDCLAAVPQDPSVFDQTIMENIKYARLSASDEDVFAACRAACIHDQIMSFPDQYNARIGERGVRLSGGELQRLAIARAILRKAKVVVLDEATSAVDTETEVSVQRALRTLSQGRTVFMVAHRLSTVVNADVILVIDKGRVVEQGSHHELLKREGRYHRLWSMQTFVETKVDNALVEDHDES